MWVARDKAGSLFLYDALPILRGNWYYAQRGHDSYALDERLFPEVTFENSPKRIEMKLVEE